jgi:hypothetical protein
MNIRIILLRVLIASWMILFSWIIMFPICALLEGWEFGVNDMIEFNRDLWNGM